MNKWNRIRFSPNLPLGADGRRVTASPEHIALSKAAAKEGMVLLKNACSALPLAPGAKVALFGKGTFDYVKGGGGSGDVAVPYVRTLYDGLKQYPDLVTTFDETDEFYRRHVAAQYAEGRQPGMMPEPELPDALLGRAAAFADAAIISISRFSGEGWDRKSAFDTIEKHQGVWDANGLFSYSKTLFPKGDFVLNDAEAALVNKVSAAFDRVIVVLNVGGMFDTSFFKDNPAVDAVLLAWQAGLEGGLAEAELLLGLDNPSGKLADTFAATLEDYPSSPSFYESDSYVNYVEDIYVGYRYFETVPGAAEKVNYPFGFGLSYTRFDVEVQKVAADGDEIEVRALVTNAGERAGKEVVQVYFGAPQGRLGKPARQLAAWQKTRLLAPGETQRLTLRFPMDQMASYDDLGKVAESAWVLEKGDYHVFVGTDVRGAADFGTIVRLDADRVVEQLSRRMAPSKLEKRMLADGSYELLPAGEDFDPDATVLEPQDFSEADGVAPAVRAVPPRHRFWDAKDLGPQLDDVASGAITVDELMAEMTDEDLACLLGGQPNTGVANTFGYGNDSRLGIPNVMTADGPAGLRILPQVGVKTTAFPCATLLACSWNPEVCRAVGRAAGEEVKENNIGVWLAPAINIHRNPLCGRNFEYYSEDPLLTARLAGALVEGVQSNGVAATIKHFALNNKETNRKESDSRASERAIREIYLKPFEVIVKENDPWSIMTSYNIINGHRASAYVDMLDGILRGEWGYEGMVTTDWWNHAEHYQEVIAGNDVKMGRGTPERLLEAMEKGALTREQLEKCARRVLNLILKLD